MCSGALTSGLAAGCVLTLVAGVASAAPLAEEAVEIGAMKRLRADTRGNVFETPMDGVIGASYSGRDGCPQVSSHTSTSFEGGTYAVQAGFVEGEIAAVSYTLNAASFPARLALMEFVFAQQNAVVTTTTQYVVKIWNGNPNTGTLIAEFESDPSGFPLPQLVMPPGTQGTNIQVSVDPSDPEQIILFGDDPVTPRTFSIGIQITDHNEQTGTGCTSAPPSNRNAFPVTDNTSSACGIGYAQLNQPTRNWLFGINCGSLGCPPNGGWSTFANLQADVNFGPGACVTGCRPRGDWVIRATWDPVNCPGVPGGCCFGTFGCVDVLDAAGCITAGGTFIGPGLTCQDANSNGTADICELPPPNVTPIAEAGDNTDYVDEDNSGFELVILDGSASSDPDGVIVSYAWDNEGVILAQTPQSITSAVMAVGNHLVRLVVTDDRGGTDEDYVLIRVLPGTGCPSCSADYDQDGGVTGSDIGAFFADFETGAPCADVDRDGGVTGADLAFFFSVFEAGGC